MLLYDTKESLEKTRVELEEINRQNVGEINGKVRDYELKVNERETAIYDLQRKLYDKELECGRFHDMTKTFESKDQDFSFQLTEHTKSHERILSDYQSLKYTLYIYIYILGYKKCHC